MSKLRQVLKLYCQGLSKLHISKSTGLSRNTVKKYLNILAGLKTTWEEVSKLSDKDLDELFCKEPEQIADERLVALHIYFKENDKRLQQRGFTLLRLWEAYQPEHPGGFSRTTFYHHHNLWRRRAKPSMHMEHKAGDKVFVDFTGEKLHVVDEQTGEIKAVEVFVAILGASQLTYVEAVETQRVEDFISCCENALHFFGGSPNAIVPDNLKSAVIKTNRYEPNLNENFEAFADHYSMTVLPARAYKPKDKALVEGAVKITYIRIFASLPEKIPASIKDLNAQIFTLLGTHNNTAFKGRSYSRQEQFDEMESKTLQPLPQNRYELRRSLHATAMKNGHVCLSVDKHYYSVPFCLYQPQSADTL
jgi:transposase